MNFGNQKLPKVLQHLVFLTFGISGITLMLRGSHNADYTDSLLLLAGGVFSSFAVFGAASIIEDIQKSKTWRELWGKIKSKFKPYDNTGRS